MITPQTPQKSNQPSANFAKYLSFSITPHCAGLLPTSELVEAVRWKMVEILPIPEMHPSVMGVCQWRGQVLWVVDLAYLLNSEPIHTHQADNSCMIVIKVQEQVLGLVVPAVGQLIDCDRQQFKPLSELSPPPSLIPYLKQGYSPENQPTYWVLDHPKILSTLMA